MKHMDNDDIAELGEAEAARARLYQRAYRLTLRYVRVTHGQLAMGALGLLAFGALATSASTWGLAVAFYVMVAVVVGRWWLSLRVTARIHRAQRSRDERWHLDGAMEQDLRRAIERGPHYSLKDEWFRWNWTSIPWWFRQIFDLVNTVAVVLALAWVVSMPMLAAVLIGGAYLVGLCALSTLETATFILQRKAVLDGVMTLRAQRDAIPESEE